MKSMGYVGRRVWVMGYCGPMGYDHSPPTNLVKIRGHGLIQVWDRRGSTVA